MDVSFVIPARNEPETVRYTVANLYTTVTRRSFEVIVVDDCSDEVLSNQLDPSHPVVCIRNAERLGVAKARNIGARNATGDLLVFLDAHVCFAPGWLEAIYRERGLLSHGLVTPATFIIREFAQFRALAMALEPPWPVAWMPRRGPWSRVYYGYRWTPLPAPQTLANFAKRSSEPFTIPIAGSAALAVTRELFARLGCFEDELAGFGGQEDAELCMRCWVLGYWVAVIPSIYCFHFKARRKYTIDYRTRPFYSEYYDQGVENTLRVLYLHLPDDEFQGVLDVYRNHPGFTPDVNAVLTNGLRQRKESIDSRRVHDYRWLLRRISRV